MKRMIKSTLALCLSLPFLAFAGGVVDGGGNTGSDTPMPTSEIVDTIKNSRRVALYIFRALDYGYDWSKNPEPAAAIGTKLFGEKYTIYNALEEAKFVIKPHGACRGPNGEANDASVDAKTKKVCFSLESLSRKLYTNSGRLELLALVAHEVSHFVGTTEAEANALQELVRARISNQPIASYDQIANRYKSNIARLKSTLEKTVIPKIERNHITFACMDLAALTTTMNETRGSNTFGDGGIMVPTNEDIDWLQISMIKKMNLVSSLCFNENQLTWRWIQTTFGEKSEISAADYMRSILKGEDPGPLPNVTIRKVLQNPAAARKEFDDIIAIATKILDRIASNPIENGTIH